MLTAPLVLVYAARLLRGVTLGGLSVRLADVLPHDADVHLTCAWATGALMSFLADSYRRCGLWVAHVVSLSVSAITGS